MSSSGSQQHQSDYPSDYPLPPVAAASAPPVARAAAAAPAPAALTRSAVVTRLREAGCVFAEDEAQLLTSAAATPADLAAMVDRRAAGLPLELVLGWASFCGLRIAMDPGVFIPRRRTEFLVREAAAVARAAAGAAQPRAVVVDLCCGSGAIGAAVAKLAAGPAHPAGPARGAAGPGRRVELHAVDINPAAIRCACRNVAAAGGRVYEGDLYEPLPATLLGGVHVLVASPPYVPAGEIGLLPREARRYEPQAALDGGADGLDIARRVIAAARPWLAPGGQLLVELSEHQASRAAEAVARSGLVPRVASSAELDATIVIGTRAARQREPGRRHDRPRA